MRYIDSHFSFDLDAEENLYLTMKQVGTLAPFVANKKNYFKVSTDGNVVWGFRTTVAKEIYGGLVAVYGDYVFYGGLYFVGTWW